MINFKDLDKFIREIEQIICNPTVDVSFYSTNESLEIDCLWNENSKRKSFIYSIPRIKLEFANSYEMLYYDFLYQLEGAIKNEKTSS